MTNTVADAGFIGSRNFDGPMAVVAVTPGSEAERAGLQVGDTIVELQGKPAGQESRQQLSRLSPGDTLSVKVRSRRGAERELKWKVGSPSGNFVRSERSRQSYARAARPPRGLACRRSTNSIPPQERAGK